MGVNIRFSLRHVYDVFFELSKHRAQDCLKHPQGNEELKQIYAKAFTGYRSTELRVSYSIQQTEERHKHAKAKIEANQVDKRKDVYI